MTSPLVEKRETITATGYAVVTTQLLCLILIRCHQVLSDHKPLWTKSWVSKLQAKRQ